MRSSDAAILASMELVAANGATGAMTGVGGTVMTGAGAGAGAAVGAGAGAGAGLTGAAALVTAAACDVAGL